MRKKEYRINWAVTAAAVLLCLTLVSARMLSGLYARYSTQVTAQDSARVAAFQVTAAFNTNTSASVPLANMQPGSTAKYTFTVTNKSEVQVRNIITLSATGNLPLTFQLDGSAITPGQPVTTSVLGYGKTATYTLTVSWDKSEIDPKYAGEIDALWFTVKSEQVN